MSDYEIFELSDVVLQSGLTLRPAQLAYKTYGQLNTARDNVIVMPTFYGGQHAENAALMAVWPALDPQQYFIIVPNMFGNGLSSSPSNTPPPFDRPLFPHITLYDMVMPGETDLYFRVRDNELEVEHMPQAELRPIPSIWGHVAGLGVNPPDNAFIDAALRELLAG